MNDGPTGEALTALRIDQDNHPVGDAAGGVEVDAAGGIVAPGSCFFQ